MILEEEVTGYYRAEFGGEYIFSLCILPTVNMVININISPVYEAHECCSDRCHIVSFSFRGSDLQFM